MAHSSCTVSESDIRPVYFHPWPLPEGTVANLKAAKAEMGVEYLIVPKQAQPGCGARVVAFEPVPWIVMDSIAYVTDSSNFEALKAAINWAATDVYDKRALTVIRQLETFFGKGVKEVTDSQLKYENISKHLNFDGAKGVSFR